MDRGNDRSARGVRTERIAARTARAASRCAASRCAFPEAEEVGDPRLAGMLDARNGNAIPVDRRPTIPFDGVDRLRYWQGRKEGENALLGGHARVGARPRASRREATREGTQNGKFDDRRVPPPPLPLLRGL